MRDYIIKYSSKLKGRSLESLFLFELQDYFQYLNGFSNTCHEDMQKEINLLKQELEIRKLKVI